MMHYRQYKSILSPKNNFNIYRGCQHGCIYCDSRSRCYRMEHDFEDIEVKTNAPEMLEAELRRKRVCCMVGTGSMTDPYIPLEKELRYTRRCLEVIEKYGFGVTLITKSALVLRDLDLLKRINGKAKCVVQMTLTAFDDGLCRIIEPNVAVTGERAEVLKTLWDSGIPTVVWLSPILPFINDTEENLRGILRYCIEAGVYGILCFGMGMTLREGDREYYYGKLDEHFPGLKKKYIQKYGNSYQIASDNNGYLMNIFYSECKKHGILCNVDEIFAYLGKFETKDNNGMEQMSFI